MCVHTHTYTQCYLLSLKNVLFCSEAQLINSVVIVLGEWRKSSISHVHVAFSPKLPFHPGCHIALSRIPCAIQQALVGQPFQHSLIFKRTDLNPRKNRVRLDQLCFCQCETKIRAFTSALEMAQEIFPSKIPLNIEGSVNWLQLFFSFIFISWRLITLQYCSVFCHTLT